MQITSVQDNLLRALRITNKAVPSRATLPITQNVLIETEDDGRLKFSATDLALSIRTWIPGMIHEPGSITVPARPLVDMVNSFPLGQVNIDSIDNPYGALIKTDSVNATLRGSPPDEFPPFPDISGAQIAKIDAGILVNALDRVVFSAATDDARPVLTAVKMEVEGEKAKFIAADGFRLSIETAQLIGEVDEPFEALIPARALSELTSLMSGSASIVEIAVSQSGGEAMFRVGDNIEIITQLIAGTYPDYRSLIPSGEGATFRIPMENIKQLVRPMEVVAREGNAALKMTATRDENEQGKLTLLASAEDFGTSEAAMNIDLEFAEDYKEDESKIAFNVRFLSETISHLQSGTSNPVTDDESVPEKEELILSMTTPSAPAVFRHTTHTAFRHVIMPMFVQW